MRIGWQKHTLGALCHTSRRKKRKVWFGSFIILLLLLILGKACAPIFTTSAAEPTVPNGAIAVAASLPHMILSQASEVDAATYPTIASFLQEVAAKTPTSVAPQPGQLSLPVLDPVVTASFGPRIHPITQEQGNHSGIDLAVDAGQTISAAADGIVLATQDDFPQATSYGQFLILGHSGGSASLYAHCSRLCVAKGQSIRQGEKIAEVGSTGAATGPHCHFEWRIHGEPVDPVPYFAYLPQ